MTLEKTIQEADVSELCRLLKYGDAPKGVTTMMFYAALMNEAADRLETETSPRRSSGVRQ